MSTARTLLQDALQGTLPSRSEALTLAEHDDLDELLGVARQVRDQGFPSLLSFSPKVFIPLTELCRDVCHYCTFAKTPKRIERPYLLPEQVLDIARRGKAAGCHEALFTLGDKPELRYSAARTALKELGFESTHDYLRAMAELVYRETGLLPHLNPGVMNGKEIRALRPAAVSMGIMLESSSLRLTEKGGPHYGSPDKHPGVRLATIARAGAENVALTSGILIGIGETRRERVESLLALRDLNDVYGHLQEVIVQNFRRKPGTVMANAPEPDIRELQWTIAIARVIFGAEMSIQAPPNLSTEHLGEIIEAGINDWGGISPVTPDHVNPEAPWPEIQRLTEVSARHGKSLVARLPLYPAYIDNLDRWVDPQLHTAVLRRMDSTGHARRSDWSPGLGAAVPQADVPANIPAAAHRPGSALRISPLTKILQKAQAGKTLAEGEITALFEARGEDYRNVCQAADELRLDLCGDTVSYVVNRNINYTNICYYHCKFCAFSKGGSSSSLRGPGYDMPLEEIQRRSLEAWQRGATEVCLQGGIHPSYSGQTYLDIATAIKAVAPRLHIHAFSALEVSQGAETHGIPVTEFLLQLKELGLGSLPGTAAEILDDEVRRVLCADKVNTAEWLDVIASAHRVGLPTTSTIMFGHVDRPVHWSRHLLRLRELQLETGGITEFVPLPFVHMEAPIYRRGQSRKGPTFREVVLMHAVARLVFHKLIPNIQASWTKLGEEGVSVCLEAGVNDLGGTLMNESISRAAGAMHGQEMSPERLQAIITAAGRQPCQRTTLYGEVSEERLVLPCSQGSLASAG
jgi:FO synthase